MTEKERKENDEHEKMCKMEMHEVISLGNRTDVMRVPGGWIYGTESFDHGNKVGVSCCFVPYVSKY